MHICVNAWFINRINGYVSVLIKFKYYFIYPRAWCVFFCIQTRTLTHCMAECRGLWWMKRRRIYALGAKTLTWWVQDMVLYH